MHHKTRLALLVVLPTLFAGKCSQQIDSGDPYCPPSAYAGEDVSTVLGSTVDVDATQTLEVDGVLLYSGYAEGCRQDIAHTYEWSFLSLPVDSLIDESALTDNNSATASVSSFSPDVVGTFVLSLQVCDEIGEEPCSASDVVTISVSSDDALPIAEAGPAQTVATGERADLDGRDSYDPDGDDLEYSWALGSTPDCSSMTSTDIYNKDTATPTLVCDCDGVFVASLAVSDGLHWSVPDHVRITCTSGNSGPLADAGETEALSPCTPGTVELNGFGSYDPDGDPLIFEWSVVSVPTGSLADDTSFSDPSAADTEFSWDIPGDYTFQLQVFDGEFWSAPDVVTLTFRDVSENTPPTANAGEPETAELEATCTTSSYVWTCDMCEGAEFDLDGTLSYDDNGDQLDYFWEPEDPNSGVSIASETSALTELLTPQTAATYGSDTSYNYDLKLTVEDCADDDSDTVRMTVVCTGVN